MGFPLIAAIGGSLISGFFASRAANKAAKVQAEAAQRATEVQREMFNLVRGDLSRYRQIGEGAVTSLGQLYGIDPTTGEATGQPFSAESLAAFRRSPDYRFALNEGIGAIEKSRAAKGLLQSGGTAKELQSFGSGLASQNFGNYVSRLMQLAGIGESAASQTGQAALQTGRGIAGSELGRGEALASGYVGSGNALTTTIGDISKNLSLYRLTNPGQGAYGPQLAGAGRF